MKLEKTKIFQNAPVPAGRDIYYLCSLCGDRIESTPIHGAACECRNIIVDVDAGRIAINNYEHAWYIEDRASKQTYSTSIILFVIIAVILSCFAYFLSGR